MDFLKCFKNKKVLVTGHTGFKGGWLTIWLKMLGADVYGYSLEPIHENGIFTVTGIGNEINDLRGDIRDSGKLHNVFQNIQPEIAFHLAAQPIVLESYEYPRETFEVNTQGTVNVLEAIRNTASVKAAVMITTDKCYENREWIWGYREDDPMGGHDPYSASKGAAEIAIASYRRSFFKGNITTGIASARAGNVIGGGDWASYRLVPDIFRAIEKGNIIDIRNPLSTRPWQHVLEPLGGYLLLASKLLSDPQIYAEAWNFGPYTHHNRPVKDVVNLIIQFAKKGSWSDVSNVNKKHEANLLLLDISKANQKLGWHPALTFDEMIRFTTDWYMGYKDNDAMELTRLQILKYEELWRLRRER